HAQQGIVTLGSSLGLDILTSEGSTLYAFSTGGTPIPFAEPGLRLGFILPSDQGEVAATFQATVLSSNGESASARGAGLDANCCPPGGAPARPSRGVQGGVTRPAPGNSSEKGTNFGAQVGIRHTVSRGHGDMRLELRYSRLGFENTSINDVGIRV